MKARRVIAAVTARRAARSGALWGSVFASLVVASAGAYKTSFATRAARAALAHSFGANAGVSALLGPARHLDTVAGFTSWRTMILLNTIGAFWGLLLATRLLRGEEEAGRWELLLAGQTTRRGAAGQAMVGLGAGLTALWAVTAAGAVAIAASPDVRFSTSAALFLATALVANAVVFVAVGSLTSQLAGTRRQANAIGASIIGAAYLLRMVADVGVGLTWLRWLSPLGWAEELHPLVGSRPLALLPIALLTVALVGGTLALAARRDAGGSTLPSRDAAPAQLRWLNGPTGLTVRLTRSGAWGWTGALAVLGFVFGLVSKSAAGAVSGSGSIERALARLGGREGGALAYMGLAFAFASALLAFVAAGHIAATRSEEADGYVDNLLVRRVGRSRWLLGRLAVFAAIVTVAGVITGGSAWLGAASQNTGVAFGDLVLAGLNIAPPAVFVLGVGALLFGVRPRWATTAAYALVTWSFLVQVVASLLSGNRWLLDTSLFHHVAPAPATDPNWSSNLWLTGIGAAAAAIGVVAFRRRDLVGS